MFDGEHVYYAIQFELVAQGEYHKKDSPLKPVAEKGWFFAGGDSWTKQINPYVGTGNNWRPRNRKASDELRSVRYNADGFGWWTRRYAQDALRRLQKANEAGELDYRDHRHSTPGVWTRAVRYRFRLVRITVKQETEQLFEESNVYVEVKPRKRAAGVKA